MDPGSNPSFNKTFVPGLKCGISEQNPTFVKGGDIPSEVEKSATLISLSTGMITPLDIMLNGFGNMWSKRAFVHYYVGDGMEEGEFSEALEGVRAIQKEYGELADAG